MHLERLQVRELLEKLINMDSSSPEFTSEVLYGLLPYHKSTAARRVGFFPALTDVREYLKEYHYKDHEWNILANKIFLLCKQFLMVRVSLVLVSGWRAKCFTWHFSMRWKFKGGFNRTESPCSET